MNAAFSNMQQAANGGAAGGVGQQPNLAALAQLLGIGGQAGGMQQQQQQQPATSQPQQSFAQALPQLFNQMAAFQQPAAQQPQQQALFGGVNPFGAAPASQPQPQPQLQQPQQQQQQQQQQQPAAGDSGGQLDFSKPMTMDQLRALGFIQ